MIVETSKGVVFSIVGIGTMSGPKLWSWWSTRWSKMWDGVTEGDQSDKLGI